MFLYLLCYVCEKKLMYIKAHEEFSKLVTNEELPGSYLKFNDGYVYSKTFNTARFTALIEDTALDIKFFSDDLITATNVNLLNQKVFRTIVLNILKLQMNDCMKKIDDMYSNEYLEMCFMKSLTDVMNASILMEQDLNNQKN